MTNTASFPLTSPFSSQECRNESAFFGSYFSDDEYNYLQNKNANLKTAPTSSRFFELLPFVLDTETIKTSNPWPSMTIHCPPRSLFDTFGAPNGERRRLSTKIHHVRVVNSYSRPLWESSFTKVKPPKKRLGEDESPGFLQAQPMDTTARLVIPKAASRKSCFAARDLNQSQSEVLLNLFKVILHFPA